MAIRGEAGAQRYCGTIIPQCDYTPNRGKKVAESPVYKGKALARALVGAYRRAGARTKVNS